MPSSHANRCLQRLGGHLLPAGAGAGRPASRTAAAASGSSSSFATPTVELRDGLQMPIFGLGVFQMSHPITGELIAGQTTEACAAALGLGYELIDTAQGYSNEEEVGDALKGRDRSSVFVVTKLTGANHGPDLPEVSLRESLSKLGHAAVDCFLVHNPNGKDCVATWRAMLALKAKGLAKSVGVSNFGVDQLRGLAAAGLELPEVNQIELHCWLQQRELVQFCEAHHIVLMGYRPTANGFKFGNQANEELITTKMAPVEDIARKLGKTAAQVAIRWSVQKGFVTIPKTVTPSRMVENLGVLQMPPLTSADMAALDAMESGLHTAGASRAAFVPWGEVK